MRTLFSNVVYVALLVLGFDDYCAVASVLCTDHLRCWRIDGVGRYRPYLDVLSCVRCCYLPTMGKPRSALACFPWIDEGNKILS